MRTFRLCGEIRNLPRFLMMVAAFILPALGAGEVKAQDGSPSLTALVFEDGLGDDGRWNPVTERQNLIFRFSEPVRNFGKGRLSVLDAATGDPISLPIEGARGVVGDPVVVNDLAYYTEYRLALFGLRGSLTTDSIILKYTSRVVNSQGAEIYTVDVDNNRLLPDTYSQTVLVERVSPGVATLELNPVAIGEGESTTITATLDHVASDETVLELSATSGPNTETDWNLVPNRDGATVLTIPPGELSSTAGTSITREATFEFLGSSLLGFDRSVFISARVIGTSPVVAEPVSLLINPDESVFPRFSVTADTEPVDEGTGIQDVFEVIRDRSTYVPTTVGYVVTVRGERLDAQPLAFDAFQTVARVPVDLSNDTFDGATSVRLDLFQDSGGNTTTTRPITDNDLQRIQTIAVTPNPVVEGQAVTVTLTRGNLAHSGAEEPLNGVEVRVAVGTRAPETLTFDFAEGNITKSLTYTIPNNEVPEVDYTATVTLQEDGAAYTIADSVTPQTVTVADDDGIDVSGAPLVTGIVRIAPAAASTTATELTWRVDFNEHVTGVDADDFEVTGLTAADKTVVNNAGFANSVDVSVSGGDIADYNGVVGLALADNATIMDSEGVSLVPGDAGHATPHTYDLDNLPPTVTLGVPANYFASIPFPVTIDFDGPVMNFAAGDVAATNSASVSAPELVSGNQYRVMVTPDGSERDIVVSMEANVLTDDVGNFNAAQTGGTATFRAVTVTLTLDPVSIAEDSGVTTVTASMDPALTVDTTITISATPESPAAGDDFTLSSNRELVIAGGVTQSTGEVTITAVDNTVDTADKRVTVSGTVSGAAGVPDPDSQTLTITDDDLPTVGVTADDSAVAEGTESQTVFTITREGQTTAGLTVRYDLTVRGVAMNNRTINIAPGATSVGVELDLSNDIYDGESDVRIDLVADESNYRLGAPTTTTRPITDDEEAPPPPELVGVTHPASPSNFTVSERGGSLTFTIEFSESDVTIDTTRFSVEPPAAGALSGFAMDGTRHTANFTAGDTLGDFTITLPADGYRNTDGVAGAASITLMGRVVPALTGAITGPAFYNRENFEVTLTFSESIVPATLEAAIARGTLLEIHPVISSMEVAGSGNRTFLLTVDPPIAITQFVQLGDHQVSPAANPHIRNVENSNTLRVALDLDAPTIGRITRQSPSGADMGATALTFRVTFSEGVTAVDAADFMVPGAPATVRVTEVAAVSPETRYDGQYSTEWDVTVTLDDDAYEGSVGLGLAGSRDIRDEAGNALDATLPTGADNQTFVRLATAIVTLALSSSTIAEGATDGAQTATITATIAPAAAAETTITVSAAAVDPAVAGDFTLSDNVELVIPVNATESTGEVTITANDNDVDAADKTVTVTGAVTGIAVADPAPQTLTITDDDLPTVGVMDDDSAVDEGTGSQNVFTITRAGQTTAPLTVRYDLTVRGVAMNDRTIEIPPGETSVGVELDLSNDTFDGATTARIDLVANAAYNLGAATTTTRAITDNDRPHIVGVEVTPNPVVEGADITVTLTRGNLAFNGRDEALSGVGVNVNRDGPGTVAMGSVNFAGGGETGSANITIPDNETIEVDYEITVTVPTNAAYVVAGGASSESVTVTDDDRTDAAGAPEILSATRSAPSSEHTNANTLRWLVNFDEHVTGVHGSDFEAFNAGTGAALSATASIHGGASSSALRRAWEVAVTGGDLADFNGAVGLRPAMNATIEDGQGNSLDPNDSGHAAPENFTLDNDAPVATLDAPSLYAPPFDVTIAFDEVVEDFADGDVTATNATVSAPTPIGGRDNTYTVTITPDGSENNIVVTLSAGAVTDLVGNPNARATATSEFEDRVVTLILDSPSIPENGGVATVTATITPAAATATIITVSAAAAGATAPGDFTLSSNAVLEIAMGATQSTGAVTITAVDNPADSGDKEVTVTATVTGATNSAPDAVTLTITDDDLPTVSVTPDAGAVDEGTALQDVFEITRAAATSEPVTVHYTITERGETSNTQTATIDADQTSVMVALDLSNDTFDGATTARIDLVANANYNLGAATTATRPITDDPEDKQEITAIAVTPDLVAEGQDITVTLTRGNLAFNGRDEALSGVGVNVNRDGPGTVAMGSVNFTGGGETGSANITIPDNETIEVDYEITVTVSTNAAYVVAGGVSSESVTVTDDDRTDAAGAPEILSATRSAPSSEHTNANTLRWLVNFDEHVTGVHGSDFEAFNAGTGAALSATASIHGGASSSALRRAWEVAVTGGDLADFNGAVGLRPATNATIEDGQGNSLDPNDSGHAASENFTLDNDAPVATLDAPSLYDPPFDVTIAFDEAVEDFADGDVTATNATVSAPTPVGGRDNAYTVTITPDGSGNNIVVTLSAGAVTDLVGNPNARTTATSEFEDRVVTLILDSPSIPENGGVATVTATIAPAATTATTITVSAAAAGATAPGDFTLSSNAVLEIAMGATQSTGAVTITAVDNPADSGDKEVTVTATVTGATNSAPDAVTLTITDDDLPTVSVTPDTGAVDEGTALQDVFEITRAAATSEPVTVHYTITERGETSNTRTATIDADQTSVMVALDLSNDTFDGATTARIDLVANANYNLGATTTTTRAITDDPEDKQEITAIAVTPDLVAEGQDITVTLTRGNLAFNGRAATLADVAVRVAVGSQPAQTLTVDFAANSDTGSRAFTIPDNGVVESDYAVVATVQPGAGYNIDLGATGADGMGASGLVTDNDNRVDQDGPPRVTSLNRHNPAAERTNADSLTWRVTFNEHVTGVDGDDFDASGLSGENVVVTVDGSPLEAATLTRSVDVTVTRGGLNTLNTLNGEVRLQLAAGATIRDGQNEDDLDPTAAGHAASQPYTVDNTAPTISAITRNQPTTARTNADRVAWLVAFSEDVTGVNALDFSVTGVPPVVPGTIAAERVDGDASAYEVTASGSNLANYNGVLSLALKAAGHEIRDTASNNLTNITPGINEPHTLDNEAPRLTIEVNPDTVAVGGSAEVTFTFDMEPEGFAQSDIRTTSGEIGNLSGSGTAYTATFTAGSSEGEAVISVAGGAWSDQAGNPGVEARASVMVLLGPAPTITGQPLFTDGATAFEVTITFEPGVTGFGAGDIAATGGATVSTPVAQSGGGGNTIYTAMVTPDGEAITLRIAAGVAVGAGGTGLAGVPNVASAPVEIPIDNEPPMLVTVQRVTEPDADGLVLEPEDELIFQVTFNEPVQVAENSNDTNVAGVDCGDFTEPEGFECVRVDAVSPSPAERGGPVSATLQNEPSDYARTFNVVYQLAAMADQVVYADVGIALAMSAEIPDRGGNDVDETVAPMSAETYSAVETTADATPMSGAPTVGVVAPGSASGPFTVWVRFNEPVTGFDPTSTDAGGDVAITGGTIAGSEETDTGSRWALSIQPNAGEVTVMIPAGAATDTDDMMVNAASSTARITVNQAQSEREMVADFMSRRASQIMAARPNLFGLLDGSGIGTSSLNLDDGPNRTFAFAGTGREIAGLFGKPPRNLSPDEAERAAARGDLWMSLKGIRTRTDDAEDDFYSMSVGAHRRLGADRIAGAFIAVDQSKTEGRGEARDDSVEGDGWLAGPYLVGRVAERGLYYQVHAAWGQSSNAVRVGEGGENSFDTDRYLVGGALKGDYQLGEWSISPVVSADWFREEQGAYTSGGTRVADQDITLGEVRAGPQFRRVLRLDSGADLSFKLGLHGVHNLAVDAEGDTPGTFEDGDTRGQVDVDFGYVLNGAHLALGLRYDGIGQDDYESWGADLRLRVTF